MRQAAPLLKVTPETVKTYCRSGDLKGVRVGRKGEWHAPGSEIIRLRALWNIR